MYTHGIRRHLNEGSGRQWSCRILATPIRSTHSVPLSGNLPRPLKSPVSIVYHKARDGSRNRSSSAHAHVRFQTSTLLIGTGTPLRCKTARAMMPLAVKLRLYVYHTISARTAFTPYQENPLLTSHIPSLCQMHLRKGYPTPSVSFSYFFLEQQLPSMTGCAGNSASQTNSSSLSADVRSQNHNTESRCTAATDVNNMSVDLH